jgi:BASS family bile acid:Na+ symporter
VVKKARGDLRYIAIMMLLTAVGTVGFMPLAVPVMIKGMTANTWAIAKPLLLFVLAPLIVGLAIRQWAEPLASRMYPMVKKTTDSATAVMLVTMLLIYGKGFLNLVGTYALATQVLFFSTMGLGAYWLGFGLKREERIVLSIGICTRNIGAAFAPLLTMEVDPRATVMVAVAVPITVLLSLVLARWFAGRGALGAVTADLTVQKSSVASGRTNNRP